MPPQITMEVATRSKDDNNRFMRFLPDYRNLNVASKGWWWKDISEIS